jgi:HD-GYP domain-containing protein (c-di-GMP phosphodiesterase class II)
MTSLLFKIDSAIIGYVDWLSTVTTLVHGPETLDELLKSPPQPKPALIVCGPPPEGTAAATRKLAEALTKAFPGTPIIFITGRKEEFDRKAMQTYGFKDAFLVPFEKAELEKCLLETLGHGPQHVESFHSVKLVDMKAGQAMDFDTYAFLPLNERYIKFSAAGRALRPEQIERLREHEINTLHVRESEMPKFYAYAAKQLSDLLGGAGGLGETERQEKAAEAVRAIVSDLFQPGGETEETSKRVIGNAQNIVNSFIEFSKGKGGSLYLKLLAVAGDKSGAYGHASNVSTFAAMFSIGLGVGDPEQMALAALLHDIGIAELPMELQAKNEQNYTDEDKKLYYGHPELSLEILKRRKSNVPEIVTVMIQLHHEYVTGNGFPSQISGKEFLEESQLLAIADRFDELTEVKPGKRHLAPFDALNSILKSGFYDDQLCSRLNDLIFPAETL